jgi:hypothetical protein
MSTGVPNGMPSILIWSSGSILRHPFETLPGQCSRAVYLDKRELTCACAGGDSRVPLGFVSLTENLAMIGMAIWMASRHLL